MNIFYKVTLQSLKKNKTRTIVTIIGIMLSAAMICAVTTFVSSIYNYLLQNAIYLSGDWHGVAYETDYATYEDILSSEKVEHAVYGQQIGYAIAEGCQNVYKPYLYILGVPEGFSDIMPVHITSGKYPTSADEILLPNHLATNGGVKYSLGDTLVLELGDRMSNGYSLQQGNPFYPDEEELLVKEKRTYSVVGFYERPDFENYSAPGYTAITVADKASSESHLYHVWFKLKNPKELHSYLKEIGDTGIYNYEENSDVLRYSGVSDFDGLHVMITGLAAIVIALIVFGSVSLIYNAFSISVSERTKQFGLLSSLGATRRQLRKMVFFEALAVSVIGIPLGILAGIGGIGVTLLFIGNKFESLTGYVIPLRICVSATSVILAVLIALVTVLLSAWIPSRRATRISAVEAIRQNHDISAKDKPIKTSRLMNRLFGLPGMLANKYYKRSRKKYRATIVSLFMSIVLFVSAAAFTDYLMETVTDGFSANSYDLTYSCYYDTSFTDISEDEILKLCRDDAGVTDAAYQRMMMAESTIDRRYLSKSALEYMDRVPNLFSEAESGNAVTPVAIYFVNDAAYQDLLQSYKLDEEVYRNPENPLGIVLDGRTLYDSAGEKYVSVHVLNSEEAEMTLSIWKDIEGYSYVGPDERGFHQYVKTDNPHEILELSEEEACSEITLKCGKIIEEQPFFVGDTGSIVSFIYPYSMMQVVLPDMDPAEAISYFFTSEDHKASYTALKQTLTESGLPASNLCDYAEQIESDRNMVTIIRVFSYGFIVLISLIAAANVFNTISTNISLRRREFAMLKSVGMTEKGLHRMLNYECLLYGSKSLLYGLPVSAGVTYLIYRAVSAGYSAGFRLPWSAIGIAVFSVFAVVFATMLYSMSKIKKDNPIDALKNENL